MAGAARATVFRFSPNKAESPNAVEQNAAERGGVMKLVLKPVTLSPPEVFNTILSEGTGTEKFQFVIIHHLRPESNADYESGLSAGECRCPSGLRV